MTMLDGPATDDLRTSRSEPTGTGRARRRLVVLLVAGLLAIVLIALGAVAALASSFGSDLRERSTLLPGTVIAGVDVSLLTASEAISAVDAALGAALDHEVTFVADGRTTTVSARALGASTDSETAVAAALDRLDTVSLVDLARLRLRGPATPTTSDAGVVTDDAAIRALVAEIAAGADRPAIDATLAFVDGELVPSASVDGFRLDQTAAIEVIHDALDTGAEDAIELPHAVVEPAIDDPTIRAARQLAIEARDRALDREVTLRFDDATWTTSAATLGGEVDGDALVTEALAAAQADAGPILATVSLPEGALTPVLDEIAAAVTVAPVNATVAWEGGRVVRSGGSSGRALDREPVADALRTSLTDESAADEIEVTTVATQPGRTIDGVRDVLVVHQSQRTVELHRGDQVLRSWPVAVGTGGSPTPTGTFVVGAKRFEPTWVNPARDRWGADMPARIGPGPDNPLGLRALNWNRLGGGDTLIRFHGTPNEDSIGSASSNGCVRMFNEDVIEMYDLVRSGTMIISRG